MAESQGFWSYVHADDDAESGRISRLARDVVDQFQMLTGESISLFLDKVAISWGDDWRKKIDSNLASIAFFIPVMTPRYFMSPECRHELQFFARRATSLGIKDLVLPLHYVDVPSLRDETIVDDLITLVRTFQWEDWRDLRFTDPSSEGYRRGVSRLATRLVDANRNAEGETVTDIAHHIEETVDITVDDSPGLLDRLAKAEEALPKWKETLQAIGQDIELIGKIMHEGTADINRGDAHGKGFAARIVVARRIARQLVEPSERIWSSGNEYVSHLNDVDDGFRAIIEKAPSEIQENPSSKEELCTFFSAVRGLSAAAHEALQSVQGMINTIAPIEKMSRDLRPVLRRLRQGLTILVEAGKVTDEWVQLIEASGVVCNGPKTQAG